MLCAVLEDLADRRRFEEIQSFDVRLDLRDHLVSRKSVNEITHPPLSIHRRVKMSSTSPCGDDKELRSNGTRNWAAHQMARETSYGIEINSQTKKLTREAIRMVRTDTQTDRQSGGKSQRLAEFLNLDEVLG